MRSSAVVVVGPQNPHERNKILKGYARFILKTTTRTTTRMTRTRGGRRRRRGRRYRRRRRPAGTTRTSNPPPRPPGTAAPASFSSSCPILPPSSIALLGASRGGFLKTNGPGAPDGPLRSVLRLPAPLCLTPFTRAYTRALSCVRPCARVHFMRARVHCMRARSMPINWCALISIVRSKGKIVISIVRSRKMCMGPCAPGTSPPGRATEQGGRQGGG